MNTEFVSIKSWAEEDRPREKMQLKGRKALTDSELLAIIIGSGTRNRSAVEIAQKILSKNGYSLYRLGKMTLEDFIQFEGIGTAKAINIMATLELGRRRTNAEIPKNRKVKHAKDAYEILRVDFMDLQHEEFRILGLSQSGHVIKNELLSKGGIAGTIVDARLLFKSLISMNASGCILAHNHPSGNLKPSHQDLVLTQRLNKFGTMIDVPILDHIIISDGGFYSFKEEGSL